LISNKLPYKKYIGRIAINKGKNCGTHQKVFVRYFEVATGNTKF
jgi:hypothetical protein